MKEYTEEHGNVDITKLQSPKLELKDYQKAHEGLVIACHDVLIEYQKGYLLVMRENAPAKGILWPIGGRIERGIKIEDSLRKKAKEESGLDIEQIQFLGFARTFFQTDPFSHGKGTDTINALFVAKGQGELRLDKMHSTPMIVTKKSYANLKNHLHPYVRDMLETAFNL